MIEKRMLDLSSNSLNYFCEETYRVQSGEFVFGYWGLKGDEITPTVYGHRFSSCCNQLKTCWRVVSTRSKQKQHLGCQK